MTKKEMTELFGVMLLAWPNAEMFKGGVAKLGPTIELWTACLSLHVFVHTVLLSAYGRAVFYWSRLVCRYT